MKLKKIVATVLTAAIAVYATGCDTDVSWVAKYNETTISPGVYSVHLVNGVSLAQQHVGHTDEDHTATTTDDGGDLMTAMVDGKTGKQYVTDYANEQTSMQLVMHEKYVELGLSLTEEEESELLSYSDQVYQADSALYSALNVTLADIVESNRLSQETFMVFEALYTQGGEYGYELQEAFDYYADTYYNALVLPIPKVDATGVALPEADLIAAKELADNYLASIEAGDMTMVDAIYEEGIKSLSAGTELPEKMEAEDYLIPVEKADNGYYFPLSLSEYLASADAGDVELIDDEYYYMLVEKHDETNVSEALAVEVYDQMLVTIKGDEFLEMADTWVADAVKAETLVYNDAALANYTPEKANEELNAYLDALYGLTATTPQLSVPTE